MISNEKIVIKIFMHFINKTLFAYDWLIQIVDNRKTKTEEDYFKFCSDSGNLISNKKYFSM